MSGVQTYWLEPTDEAAVGLRRYSMSKDSGFTCEAGYHSALIYTGRAPVVFTDKGNEDLQPAVDHDDQRWPTVCEKCPYAFSGEDQWQEWQQRLWRRTDTGELRVLHSSAPAPDAPTAEPGACWDAQWMPDNWKHADGLYLMVRCPCGHDWAVDSRASNCGLPGDSEHQCWVRHGDPRECRVTVDKDGFTCNAGAGSILTPNWHGFLRDGQLVT